MNTVQFNWSTLVQFSQWRDRMHSVSDERKETSAPRVTAHEAKTALGALLLRASVDRQRVVITRHGAPVAAVIGIHDLEKLEQLEKEKHEAATAA
jgi:prevent-host-death family protein